MTHPIQITYWSDYACPFCFIGERNLKQAINNLGIHANCTLEMKAFELSPQIADALSEPTNILLARKYGLPLAEADRQIQRIEAMGKESGIALDYAHTRYGNTRKAHLLTKKALQIGGRAMADLMAEHLFSAFFEKNELLSEESVLLACASAAGLTEEDARNAFTDSALLQEVLADESSAAAMGVQGVPYFVLGNAIAIPGALSVSEMEKVLLQLLSEKEKQAEENGMCCGPDGCC